MIKDYSQRGEQKAILKAFNHKKGGRFIDIGAADGVFLSNTFALAKHYGWTGVLVEPEPKSFEAMLNNYEGLDGNQFIQAAICHQDGDIDFYQAYGGNHSVGTNEMVEVSTLKKDMTKKWEDNFGVKYNKITVEGMSIESLVRQIPAGKYDLLSLDIEYMDLEILPKIPFHSLQLAVVVVEWNSINQKAFDQIMIPNGYRMIHRTFENLIYLNRKYLT